MNGEIVTMGEKRTTGFQSPSSLHYGLNEGVVKEAGKTRVTETNEGAFFGRELWTSSKD